MSNTPTPIDPIDDITAELARLVEQLEQLEQSEPEDAASADLAWFKGEDAEFARGVGAAIELVKARAAELKATWRVLAQRQRPRTAHMDSPPNSASTDSTSDWCEVRLSNGEVKLARYTAGCFSSSWRDTDGKHVSESSHSQPHIVEWRPAGKVWKFGERPESGSTEPATPHL